MLLLLSVKVVLSKPLRGGLGRCCQGGGEGDVVVKDVREGCVVMVGETQQLMMAACEQLSDDPSQSSASSWHYKINYSSSFSGGGSSSPPTASTQ